MSQVQAISPVNQTYQTSKKNYPRADYTGALTTAGMGGVAWGVGEYIFNKKPFLNNEEMVSDLFVKSVKEGLEGIKDSKFLENKEALNTLNTQIDKCNTVEQLKEFFKNNKKDIFHLTERDGAGVTKYIEEVNDVAKSKEFLKSFFENQGKNKSYVQEIYESCCDKAGKLVHDAQKVSKEKSDIIKNTADKFRKNNALKAAVSFAIISATIMCVFEYFKGRKAKKMAKQELQQQMPQQMQQPTIQKA